jgi:hypothetical protein
MQRFSIWASPRGDGAAMAVAARRAVKKAEKNIILKLWEMAWCWFEELCFDDRAKRGGLVVNHSITFLMGCGREVYLYLCPASLRAVNAHD